MKNVVFFLTCVFFFFISNAQTLVPIKIYYKDTLRERDGMVWISGSFEPVYSDAGHLYEFVLDRNGNLLLPIVEHGYQSDGKFKPTYSYRDGYFHLVPIIQSMKRSTYDKNGKHISGHKYIKDSIEDLTYILNGHDGIGVFYLSSKLGKTGSHEQFYPNPSEIKYINIEKCGGEKVVLPDFYNNFSPTTVYATDYYIATKKNGRQIFLDWRGKEPNDGIDYRKIENKYLGKYNIIKCYSDNSNKGPLLDPTLRQITNENFEGTMTDMDGYLYVKAIKNGKVGLLIFGYCDNPLAFGYEQLKRIFEPEFEDCDVLGKDLYAFKVNGFWGVSNEAKKIIIPTSRQYTKIEYNKTFKKFYFEKKTGNTLYKGECNAKGVQTSIAKVKTTQPATTTKQQTNNNKPQNTQKGTSDASTTTKKGKTAPAGLLYKGEYTWGGQARVNGNLQTGENGFNKTDLIEIYEDYLTSGTGWLIKHKYKGTTASGERMYTATDILGESTVYVSSSFNIRQVIRNSANQWGAVTTEYQFSKGKSFMYEYEDNGGGYNTSPSSNNSSTNPIQPHQVTKDCSLCLGSGKCNTCNGKHWYYGAGGSKITCPNCKPNGACSSCGGSGKMTSTKYY